MSLTPFWEASWLVQIHLLAAVSAIVLGVVQLAAPKGVLSHRVMGWTWVGLVAVAVATSIFLHRPDAGLPELWVFSPVHVLTLAAAIGLPVGVWAARRRKVLLHRAVMTAVFAGALIIAALFSLLPGRLLYDVLRNGQVTP